MKKNIIVVSCICIFCAFGTLVYFIFIHRSVADYLEMGQSAMRKGDIKAAEKFFLEVTVRDNANEVAYEALAEIAEKDQRPTWAARYWGIAASLNPLSKEIKKNYIKALLNASRYYTITEQLEGEKVTSLSDYELYALTKASFFRNNTAQTRKLLVSLLKRSPKDPKVILFNARFLLASGNPQEAKKNFISLSNCQDKASKTNSLIGLGHVYIALRKIKKAGIYYNKAVKNSPDAMEVLMILANYNLNSGNPKLAESQYQQLHKNLPKNIIITITLAEIYAKNKNIIGISKLLNTIKISNQVTIAAKYYLRALLAYIANDSGKMEENLHLCKIFSTRPLYAYLQFQEILASNNVRNIRKHLAVLLKINDSLTARTDLANQIKKVSIENFNNNKLEKTTALAAIMQKLLPEEDAIAHLAMVCAYEQKEWRKAISEANKFNRISPNTLDYLSIKGRSLLYLNEAERALPLLKKLTILTPKKPEVWLWTAQAYQLLGKQKKIDECIGKMLQLANNSHSIIDPAVSFFLSRNNKKISDKIAKHLLLSKDKTFNAMAWSIKAQTAQKWQSSVKYLIKVYTLKKDNDTLLYIADIYLQHKKYNEAMQYITKALKNNPKLVKAAFRQALIFQKLKDYDQAVKHYKMLLKQYPKWSLVLVNLSDIMSIKGKKQEALALARKAQDESASWTRAKICLGLRELDCKHYSSALTIFESLIKQEPDNKIAKNAIPRCLVPIIQDHIEKNYLMLARIRLKQLKEAVPHSKDNAVLGELLMIKEKASRAPTENKLL